MNRFVAWIMHAFEKLCKWTIILFLMSSTIVFSMVAGSIITMKTVIDVFGLNEQSAINYHFIELEKNGEAVHIVLSQRRSEHLFEYRKIQEQITNLVAVFINNGWNISSGEFKPDYQILFGDSNAEYVYIYSKPNNITASLGYSKDYLQKTYELIQKLIQKNRKDIL